MGTSFGCTVAEWNNSFWSIMNYINKTCCDYCDTEYEEDEDFCKRCGAPRELDEYGCAIIRR